MNKFIVIVSDGQHWFITGEYDTQDEANNHLVELRDTSDTSPRIIIFTGDYLQV